MNEFEYIGVQNNVMIFREKLSGMGFQLNHEPVDDVELLEGDRVRFQGVADYERRTYSIREGRQVMQ